MTAGEYFVAALVLFVVISVIGAIVGDALRNQAMLGAILGLLLGPLGVLIVFFLPDLRRKCYECGGVIVKGARRCKSCGSATHG